MSSCTNRKARQKTRETRVTIVVIKYLTEDSMSKGLINQVLKSHTLLKYELTLEDVRTDVVP